MGLVIYNNKSLDTIGGVVEHPPIYEIPERNYNVTSVPGRNGDLTMDTGSYKNVNRPYDLAFGSLTEDFIVMANALSGWLNSASGYARLEDSYEPAYYRMAKYSEGGNIANILQHGGRITVNFDCKPQRFLKTGELKTIISSAQTLTNPTNYLALPMITVKGSGNGSLYIGQYTVDITTIVDGMILNCELEDAYDTANNLNDNITVANDKFPKLVPGDNPISFTGGITSVEIIPRWWTI